MRSVKQDPLISIFIFIFISIINAILIYFILEYIRSALNMTLKVASLIDKAL